MIILAIETSCDDTGVAILKVSKKKKPSFAPLDPESSGFQFGDKKSVSLKLNKIPVLQGGDLTGFTILSNIVSSQIEVHKKWGGVHPSLAKREHQKNLPVVLKKALDQAKNPKIDLISVTSGPGLEPCLWVGVNFAKDLAKRMNLPIVLVNHIEEKLNISFEPEIPFEEGFLYERDCEIYLLRLTGNGKWSLLNINHNRSNYTSQADVNEVKKFLNNGEFKHLGKASIRVEKEDCKYCDEYLSWDNRYCTECGKEL